MVKVSHWYGRLGNNIQQCAVAVMAAQFLKSTFTMDLDHEIITPHQTSFGPGTEQLSSKWFYWEGPYKETNIPVDYIYAKMREVCKTYISPNLSLPKVDPIGDDTIVIHIRSGDVFDQGTTNPVQYAPNPLYFYNKLIELFDKALVVTEPDSHNPIIEELRKNSKVTVQSKSVAEDFATLMAAKHLANSGVGTFGVAAALCSSNIERFYCTDVRLTEHLNYRMLENTDVSISLMTLGEDYIKPGEWNNSDEQRKYILTYDPTA